ncbi:MAG: FHA domain-containing protein [Pirellulales bacterium]
MYGELHPVGGGDPIPLLKVILLVGRRESSDIVLRFPNVSGNHCELELIEGYWYVHDLNSRNGTKVNGERVKKQRLIPEDKLSIARHVFQIRYEPTSLGAVQTALEMSDRKDIFGKSLLESAGLESKSRRGRHRHGR